MSYKNFLQAKVGLARDQMKAGNYISNEQVSAKFSGLRVSLVNKLIPCDQAVSDTADAHVEVKLLRD